MPERIAGKREASKLERKERLYEAALSLFHRQGYDSTTVDQITRQANLAKGTFFNYFPTKDAVLRYMGEREVGRLGAALVGANGTSSIIGKLQRLLTALAASLERDRDLVCLIVHRGISVSELMTGDAGGFSIQPTASLLIRQAQRHGEVSADLDPDVLAGALDALYLQQLVIWCENPGAGTLGERLTAIVDLLLYGAVKRSPEPELHERAPMVHQEPVLIGR